MKNNWKDDKQFINKIVNQNLKVYHTRLIVLDKQERAIQTLEGRTVGGSLSINGTSSLRRTCSLTMTLDKKTLTSNLDFLITKNRKVKLEVGFKNTIDERYEEVVWFPLGLFVITQPNISHSVNNCTINVTLKDKMCLLNGECGGGLPASVTFHEYDQTISLTEHMAHKPQTIFDIIQTLVHTFGHEDFNNIVINDLPKEIKQIVRYTGTKPLYYGNSIYTYDTKNQVEGNEDIAWTVFNHNDEIGYTYTPFIYPGDLISGIGDTVCSVLDKLIQLLGNYEYYYDVYGRFVFREKRNNLNTSLTTDILADAEHPSVLDENNYRVDFSDCVSAEYTFDNSNNLILAFTNAPNPSNIKNDFHIWGKTDDSSRVIHYHVALKSKPALLNTYQIKIDKEHNCFILAEDGDPEAKTYTPRDWRIELYLQGLSKKKLSIRPSIDEQELIDWLPTIYDFEHDRYKADILKTPNDLNYFIDYLEPIEEFHEYSIDNIGERSVSYQENRIIKIYNTDIPNLILVPTVTSSDSEEVVQRRKEIIERCKKEGQSYANVSHDVFKQIAVGSPGYTAQEVARDMLYRFTSYNESISIQGIPIYFLEPNTRVTVQDKTSDIYGDYVVQSLSLPLDGKTPMSITATRALTRL